MFAIVECLVPSGRSSLSYSFSVSVTSCASVVRDFYTFIPRIRYYFQVLGENAAEAEKLFAGEPETALIASILWAFEVGARRFLYSIFDVPELFCTVVFGSVPVMWPVAPVAQRYHVTSDTLGREFDPGKRDFPH